MRPDPATTRNLDEINQNVHKVTEVMAEIVAASDQQNQGTAQISQAVEQMNQVTQQTAANAEQSAASSEELTGQSVEMLSMVGTFHFTNQGYRARLNPALSRN